MPSNSDMIKWAEQGRLHIKYTSCDSQAAAANQMYMGYQGPILQLFQAVLQLQDKVVLL